MSLVGTRPILQDELQKYELHHRARIAIKPGITGMWQVSGRSDITDFEEVVRLDTEYISNWNFGLDIKILFKTVMTVLKTRTVVFMAVIVLLLGTFQIQTYLMNVNAPRYLFFYYGGKTANTYFPLGSGFATFGSDQAARNYSRLYYQYGFNSLFGMNTKDGSFLSDTFWPMAIGQFGWIGSILYILIYVRIFFSFKWMNLNSEQKALLYAGYMQYIIHAVGSAILSAPAGMIGAIALAAVMKPANEVETID